MLCFVLLAHLPQQCDGSGMLAYGMLVMMVSAYIPGKGQAEISSLNVDCLCARAQLLMCLPFAGVETMSNNPMAWEGGINGRIGDFPKAQGCLMPMGVTSENVAAAFGVSRCAAVTELNMMCAWQALAFGFGSAWWHRSVRAWYHSRFGTVPTCIRSEESKQRGKPKAELAHVAC
jgi:hypothetical protein